MLYTFLDESGNLDFSNGGSKYFILTSLSLVRPFPSTVPLMDLKHDLWEQGVQIEYFHAAEDRQATRNNVFSILTNDVAKFRLDSVIVEKRKTHPVLQNDPGRFYTTFFKILLRYVLEGQRESFDEIMIVSDKIPLRDKKKAIEKGIKKNLSSWAARDGNKYTMMFCASKSEHNLQVVDYLSWAIQRKWERNDLRSYLLIKSCVQSEFDVFQAGSKHFY